MIKILYVEEGSHGIDDWARAVDAREDMPDMTQWVDGIDDEELPILTESQDNGLVI